MGRGLSLKHFLLLVPDIFNVFTKYFQIQNSETKFCQIKTDYSQFLTLRHMLDSQAFFLIL